MDVIFTLAYANSFSHLVYSSISPLVKLSRGIIADVGNRAFRFTKHFLFSEFVALEYIYLPPQRLHHDDFVVLK